MYLQYKDTLNMELWRLQGTHVHPQISEESSKKKQETFYCQVDPPPTVSFSGVLVTSRANDLACYAKYPLRLAFDINVANTFLINHPHTSLYYDTVYVTNNREVCNMIKEKV